MVRALDEKGAAKSKYPKFYWREPKEGPLDAWFIQAYLWLTSERYFQGGPISFLARMEFGDMHGLSYEASLCVAIVVSHLDKAFWDYRHERDAQEREAQMAIADQTQEENRQKKSRWGR